jgi:hypothetical protein
VLEKKIQKNRELVLVVAQIHALQDHDTKEDAVETDQFRVGSICRLKVLHDNGRESKVLASLEKEAGAKSQEGDLYSAMRKAGGSVFRAHRAFIRMVTPATRK